MPALLFVPHFLDPAPLLAQVVTCLDVHSALHVMNLKILLQLSLDRSNQLCNFAGLLRTWRCSGTSRGAVSSAAAAIAATRHRKSCCTRVTKANDEMLYSSLGSCNPAVFQPVHFHSRSLQV